MVRGKRWLILGLLLLTASQIRAQARPSPTPLAVGTMAPAFELPAATRNGVSPAMARLEDFRGQTVVLAFFYKARTGG